MSVRIKEVPGVGSRSAEVSAESARPLRNAPIHWHGAEETPESGNGPAVYLVVLSDGLLDGLPEFLHFLIPVHGEEEKWGVLCLYLHGNEKPWTTATLGVHRFSFSDAEVKKWAPLHDVIH